MFINRGPTNGDIFLGRLIQKCVFNGDFFQGPKCVFIKKGPTKVNFLKETFQGLKVRKDIF